MSRYSFFLIAFSISFCWYWFPDFIFPALGCFTFVCWAAPKNAVVNQVIGMNSGSGLLPVTFDCRSCDCRGHTHTMAKWITVSQIAYIGSLLVVPTWAFANVLAALVFWVYIISPALYSSSM